MHSPSEVVTMLAELFMDFDKVCLRKKLYKLYTIGDCYVALGLFDNKKRKKPAEEAYNVVMFAGELIRIINTVRRKINFPGLDMRIGIHTGDIVCGIVGTEIVRFDIYGANVFCANKMESGGQAGKINVSSVTKDLLMEYEFDKGVSLFDFEFNDDIYVKSMGSNMKSYFCWTR